MDKKRIKRAYRISKLVVYKETLVDYREKLWTFIGYFIGIGSVAFIQNNYFTNYDNLFLIGSFGATSVLIYGVIQSPLAQPRNLIGGHVVSAIIGVSVYQILPDILWINAPLAVSLSIVAMQYTKTLHPPGGASALIAVTGSEKIIDLGYLYVLFPVLSGVLILFFVALIINNITSRRKYPNDGRFSYHLKWFIQPIRKVSKKLEKIN